MLLSVAATLSAQTDTTETVVISAATKFEVPVSKTVNQVMQIQAARIQFQNSQTTADLLQNSGSVFVQRSQGGGGSPVLRGFEANKVSIVVDNVRMNNAIFRGGHLQNVLRVDANSLESAEVLFGPGSLIYGSDALGGVMSFKTLSPKTNAGGFKVKANVQSRFGTVNRELTNHFDLTLSGKKWASLTSFTYSDYRDMRQGKAANPFNKNYPRQFDRTFYVERIDGKDSVFSNAKPELQVGTAFSQYNFIQKLMFQPKQGITHSLNFYASATSNVHRYDRLTEVANDKPRFAEWYYGPEKWTMLNYQFAVDRSTKLYDRLLFVVAGQQFEESRHSRRLNNPSRKSQIEQVGALSVNMDMMKLWTRFIFNYGLEAITNGVKSTAYFTDITNEQQSPADTRYPDGGSSMGWYSLYANSRFDLNSRFSLHTGIRSSYNRLNANFVDTTFFPFPFRNVSQTSWGNVGNVAVVYAHPKAFRASLMYSSGYRVPNVDDVTKVFESRAGMLIVPNPGLKPEYTGSTELSLVKTFANRLNLNLTAYYTQARNLLATEKSNFEGKDSVLYEGANSAVYRVVNKNRAYILGGFAGINYHVYRGLSLYGSYTYTYGRIPTDTTAYPLDHIPPMFGRLGMSYQRAKWQAELFVLFQGAKKLKDYNLNGEDNFQYATPEGMPAWYTLNLKTSYQVLKSLRIYAGVENLLDTNYRIFASGVSGPGRNVFVSLRAGF